MTSIPIIKLTKWHKIVVCIFILSAVISVVSSIVGIKYLTLFCVGLCLVSGVYMKVMQKFKKIGSIKFHEDKVEINSPEISTILEKGEIIEPRINNFEYQEIPFLEAPKSLFPYEDGINILIIHKNGQKYKLQILLENERIMDFVNKRFQELT